MMIAWHQRSSSCVFGDILDMISNKVSENDLLDPKKITWKRTAWCAKHQKECLVWHPEPNQYGLGVWAKCGLFSTSLGSKILSNCFSVNLIECLVTLLVLA